MYSIGGNVKLFYTFIIIFSIYCCRDVLVIWQQKSTTDISNGLIVHNFTEANRCIGYRQCTYDMCMITKESYASIVTVSFEGNPTCRSPNWVLVDPAIIVFIVFASCNIILAVISAALITARDTRIFYRGHRVKNSTWRLIRLGIFSSTALTVIMAAINVYYHSTTSNGKMSPLEMFSFVSVHIAIAAGLCLVGYFSYTSVVDINKKLDLIREGLEDDDTDQNLLTE